MSNTIEVDVYELSLIIEGATEKVSQFMMSLKSMHNKKLKFNEQKYFLNA